MIVNVYHHNFHDFNATPLSIDDAFKAFLAAGGIHELDSFNRLEITSDMLTPDSGLTISSGMKFQLTATGTNKRAVIEGFTHPLSFSIRGTINRPGWFLSFYELEPNCYWAAGVSKDGYACIWQCYNGSWRLVQKSVQNPWGNRLPHKFELTVRRWQSDSQGILGRLSIGLFINNVVAVSCEEEVKIQFINSQVGLGLMGDQSLSVTFSNIRIPDFAEVMDVISIDPGEPPMGGLGRAIEGVYLKMFMRHNKALRAYRPFLHSTASQYTFQLEDLEELVGPSVDVRGLRSHLRQQGAYTEAEIVDAEILKKYGYRFEQMQNPFLMTVDECYLEGKRALRRMVEESKSVQFTTYGRPLIEIEDIVTLDGTKYRVTSKEMNFIPGQIEESYSLRGVFEPSLYDVSVYDGATYE